MVTLALSLLQHSLNNGLALQSYKGSKSGPAIIYDGTSEFGKVTGKRFNILPKEYWSEDSNSGCINQNMGSREIGYNGVMADDAYIIRVYYTTDDLGNLQVASGLETWGDDNTDTYGANISDADWNKYYTLENRVSSYVDYWFLPEGVSTVLNFEDETPAPSPSEDNYTVDLGDSQIVSADTFATILAENATKDVIIKSNNNVTFTFAKGTMSSVDGKTEYDFSTSINSAYADTIPSYITKDNFVSQINFNYSGKLPATANIRFYAGTEYAGQTLYYSLMNADNTFAEVQAVVVDADGSSLMHHLSLSLMSHLHFSLLQDCHYHLLIKLELIQMSHMPSNMGYCYFPSQHMLLYYYRIRQHLLQNIHIPTD